MLPKAAIPTPHSIFINPNFNQTKVAHINPDFLLPAPTTIHLNPKFLQKTIAKNESVPTLTNHTQTKVLNKIISKSRTKIVRESSTGKFDSTNLSGSLRSTSFEVHGRTLNGGIPDIAKVYTAPAVQFLTGTKSQTLIKIGLRKLIRGNVNSSVASLKTHSSKSAVIESSRSARIVEEKYKIDRRFVNLPNTKLVIKPRKKSFVGQYALRRTLEGIPMVKVNNANVKNLSNKSLPYKSLSRVHRHRKLQIICINGIQYKSTRNKLQRNDRTQTAKTNNNVIKHVDRTLFVRGTKFLWDKDGFKITRVVQQQTQSGCRENSLKRIDIGGLTYIAKSTNEFIRTGSHLVRSHVSSAKQKSISLLSRSYVKSNIPCIIFQRLGKCAAYDRNKCMKVHDRKQISICPKFLRGECSQSDCLLSHHVSLSKMPVCKFFLQGCCVRSDCPYLHKKLSQNTEICSEFLKGFCKLAQKCNKRHEFVCPDFESKGKCVKIKCQFCHKRKRHNTELNMKNDQQTTVTTLAPKKENDFKKDMSLQENLSYKIRYFKNESEKRAETTSVEIFEKLNDPNLSNVVNCDKEPVPVMKGARPKLGELPAFIPFS